MWTGSGWDDRGAWRVRWEMGIIYTVVNGGERKIRRAAVQV